MKTNIEGFWRDIISVIFSEPNSFSKRYKVKLRCGHSFLIHPEVKQFNGLIFDTDQKAYFCTDCKNENENKYYD